MKKTLQKIVIGILVFACVFAGGSQGSSIQARAAAKMYDAVFTDNRISLQEGQAYSLKIMKNNVQLEESRFSYRTSDATVAGVTSKGVIKAKKAGSATIVATLKTNSKQKVTFTVIVRAENMSVTIGNTAETSYGIKIPVVSEFNKLALIPGNDWTGEGEEANSYDTAWGKALFLYNKLAHYSTDSPIQDSGLDILHNGMAFDGIGPVALMRNFDKGSYYFYYTMDLSDMSPLGIAIERDLSRFMLAMITSTPTEVEDALYRTMYGPDGEEPIDIKGAWTRIGDCKIKYTYGHYSKGTDYLYEFKIMAAD
ncbi:MAG: Ig-like domain-containing protein [bacterium]|nr:Ig-like domain-containing protein [bacterium]